MYFKKNWGNVAEKGLLFERVDIFQTSPSRRFRMGVWTPLLYGVFFFAAVRQFFHFGIWIGLFMKLGVLQILCGK